MPFEGRYGSNAIPLLRPVDHMGGILAGSASYVGGYNMDFDKSVTWKSGHNMNYDKNMRKSAIDFERK